MDLNLMKYLADAVGASEPAFRLLFSILAAYPISWIFLAFLKDSSPFIKNVFFTICGIGIGVFNFSFDVYHSVLAVLFTYVTLKLMGPSKNLVLINLVFHILYLITGYWITETDTYDIKWTMPHCVLVLRLIGLCFDLWDGSQNPEKLSSSFKKTALSCQPSLLEISAHTFFPASYLVGPQFSMMQFMNFINGKFATKLKSNVSTGCTRALIGLLYLAFYQIGTIYFSIDYFLTPEFNQLSIIKKHFLLGIWGKIFLSKYLSCWLLTEGACITVGLAYNGEDKGGNVLWDGCRNINIKVYEGCTKFGHYIESFNLNTNHWAAQYIYKRLAFLGNRYISQVATLVFLALWHGLHSGYYMTFFLEFAIMFMEKEFISILNKNDSFVKISETLVFRIISFVILKLYAVIFMGYCLIPFALLNFYKWWPVYSSLYFSGFILFLPWGFLYKPILKTICKPSKAKKLTE